MHLIIHQLGLTNVTDIEKIFLLTFDFFYFPLLISLNELVGQFGPKKMECLDFFQTSLD